jgi:replicative DNA helicase
MEPILVNDNTAESYVVAALVGGRSVDYILSQVDEDDFSSDKTRGIYRVIAGMAQAGETVDMITTQPKLTASHLISLQDHMDYVKMLSGFKLTEVPSYVERLKIATQRKAILRMLVKASGELREHESPDKILQGLMDALVLHSPSSAERTLILPETMAQGCLEAVSNRMDMEKRKASVINLSFGSINRAIGGFEKGDLIILSAESGAGKSAFSMNIARDVGVAMKRPILYMNSEMTTEQQELRWASCLSGVSHSAIRAGAICTAEDNDEYKKIGDSLNGMLHSKLYTLNMPDMQISNVLSEIRLLHKRYDLEMVIVDYIGRMDTMNIKDTVKEWQLMLNSARMLKTLATELKIVVVMVAQLTKDGCSLAQGSYMKHEADLWLNICRWKDEKELAENYPWNCFIEVRKARNVETGKALRMYFNGDTLTFTDDEARAEEYAKANAPVEVPV